MADKHKKYDHFEVQKVKDIDIRHMLQAADVSKASQTIVCPECGKKRCKVEHNSKRNSAHCFACDFNLSNGLDAYAWQNGLDLKTNFLEALEGAARQYGITLHTEDEQRQQKIKDVAEKHKKSFCAEQMAASGLTFEDVMAHVVEGDADTTLSPFRKGRPSTPYMADESADDMMIYYYGLDGKPMMYMPKNHSKPAPYVRVRWANPDIHKGKDGKPFKYMTPAGAPCRVYIPEAIRSRYKTKTPIETLFLQEGEKKAEKACKHGMLSIGIQGINNFGSQQEGLIQDIQDIVAGCKVKNIVLVMDSDWDNLHSEIVTGDSIDKRPNSFAHAVIKYKQYMKTFNNLKLYVDTWWGHVNVNEHDDKGVDDLLVGSLAGKESELMEDVTRTMNSHNGKGKWLDIHKISEYSDARIREFWALNDAAEFYKRHARDLGSVEVFKIGQIRYTSEDGKLKSVSRYASDSDIYTISTDSKERDKVSFNPKEAFKMLHENGFMRVRSEDDASGYEYVRNDDGIISRVLPYEIRDFVREYIFTNCKSPMVQNYFYEKLTTLLADKQLENLNLVMDTFNNFTYGVQRSYFNNGQVEITADKITPNLPIVNVWRNRIVPRKFKRIPIIKNIERLEDGTFTMSCTEEGLKCEFLTYLVNTSNMFYKFGEERQVTPEEDIEWVQHVVNKITAMGYLLCDYKFSSERKAVVAQDHQMSEVGRSKGGAGKSLFGNAIEHFTCQTYINGKEISATDQFMLSEVTRATRNIFIDDVKTNFDFERFYNVITGPMPINPKGLAKFTIPVDESPKILITTNHTINGAENDSTGRRITYIEFSEWYNKNHTPFMDFKHMMFDGWDEYQWCLFDNLMAECVMYYLRSFELGWAKEGEGAVPPPMSNIKLRNLRQKMGETLFQWAEWYFDPTGSCLNQRLNSADVWTSYCEYTDHRPEKTGVTRAKFKEKLLAYCEFKSYDFNYTRPNAAGDNYADWKDRMKGAMFEGTDDKSNGKIYYTISNDKIDETTNNQLF